eukprot:scaffold278312_cov33-Tisochrysis_lutea.AAC.3
MGASSCILTLTDQSAGLSLGGVISTTYINAVVGGRDSVPRSDAGSAGIAACATAMSRRVSLLSSIDAAPIVPTGTTSIARTVVPSGKVIIS